MTCAGRRVVVGCVVVAVAGSVSACKVLPRAESPSASAASMTAAAAAADGLDAAAEGDAATCLFSAGEVSEVLGGRWTVSSLPSGGCNYSQNSRSILVSEAPLPRDARGRQAALVQTRKPCDAGSAQSVASVPDAFVCRQGTLLEAVTIVAGRLVVVCTEAGSNPAEVPGVRAALGALLARAG